MYIFISQNGTIVTAEFAAMQAVTSVRKIAPIIPEICVTKFHFFFCFSSVALCTQMGMNDAKPNGTPKICKELKSHTKHIEYCSRYRNHL